MHKRTAAEFLESVAFRTREYPETLRSAVAAVFVEHERTSEPEELFCAKLVGRLAGLVSEEPSARSRGDSGHSTPVSRLTESELLSRITPMVQAVRDRIFGTPDPPFRGRWDSAVKWLEDTEEKQEPFSKEEGRRAKELEDMLFATLRELNELGGSYVLDDTFDPRLPYLPPGATRAELLEPVRDPLLTLAEAVRRLTRFTGFPQYQVLEYLLTGAEPSLPAWESVNESDTQILRFDDEMFGMTRRRKIVATVNTGDIRASDLKRIQRHARKSMPPHGRRTKPPSGEKEEWGRFLAAVGEPPEGERSRWRWLANEWNRQHPEQPKTEGALRKLDHDYRRVVRELTPPYADAPDEEP